MSLPWLLSYLSVTNGSTTKVPSKRSYIIPLFLLLYSLPYTLCPYKSLKHPDLVSSKPHTILHFITHPIRYCTGFWLYNRRRPIEKKRKSSIDYIKSWIEPSKEPSKEVSSTNYFRMLWRDDYDVEEDGGNYWGKSNSGSWLKMLFNGLRFKN